MLDPPLDLKLASEPAYCPSCELRHTRRPDWLCPRCGAPVESGVPRAQARPAPEREQGFPAGSRVAGAVMTVGGGALAAAWARSPPAEHRWPLLAAVVLLVVLGLASLLGRSWARWTAFVAAVAAGVLAAEDLLRVRLPALIPDPVPPGVRAPLRALMRPLHPVAIFLVLAFVAGSLTLLAGRPRRARVAAGVLLAAPLVVLAALRAFGG